MTTLVQDLRYGVRMLLRNPALAATAVLTVAVGIGASTAIFSVVRGVLIRPLPYEAPDRLVRVFGSRLSNHDDHAWISVPDFIDYEQQNGVFQEVSASWTDWFNLTGKGDPEVIPGALVTGNHFRMLGVRASLGRVLTPEDARSGAARVAVIARGMWQSRFGSNPDVIGRTLTLDDNSFTVVGVLPPDFRSPESERQQIWIPIALDGGDPARIAAGYTAENLRGRQIRFLSMYARLRPGVTLDRARSEMTSLGGRLEREYPQTNTGWSVNVVSLSDALVGDVKTALLILLGAASFVVLIACANVANLLLARASTRHREIAIRTAMGAHRGRVVRQLLTESLVIAAFGGASGVLLGQWGLDGLLAAAGTLPRQQDVRMDGWVLAFAIAVTAVTTILFGLAPALQASKVDLSEALKESGRSSTAGGRRERFRSAVVVCEMGLSLILLIGAALLIKSFLRLRDVDPGLKTDHLLTMYISLPESRYGEAHRRIAFFEDVEERVEALPGIESAALAFYVPLSGSSPMCRYAVDGRPPAAPGEVLVASFESVGPGYFRTMGIPLRAGRDFGARDSGQAPPVAVINETMARLHFPGENPIGRRLTITKGPPTSREIVGIVGDVRHTHLSGEPTAEVYVPFRQQPWSSMALVVRTSSDPLGLAAAVRGQIRAIDPDQPVSDVKEMEAYLAASVSQPRFNALLLTVFSVLALFLAAVGIYGVMSYAVAQRTQEIGIRVALGARPRDVVALVVGRGMSLALAGLGAGLLGALALTRLMSNLLYGVGPTDPITFALIAILFSGVALLANYIPARRATRVDPIVALRGN